MEKCAMRRFFKSVPTKQTNMEGFSIPKRCEYRLYGKDPLTMWMRHWLDDGRLAAMISWELTDLLMCPPWELGSFD